MIRPFKSLLTLACFCCVIASTSCHNASKEDQKVKDTAQSTEAEQKTEAAPAETSQSFDINSIPVSTHPLEAFPFFSLPKDLVEQNKPVQRSYDKLFFAINGVMTPLEGRVWKSYIVTKPGSTEEWSQPYFEKSYDDAITKVGGVKIFDGEITKAEYERYHNQASYLGEDGSIGYDGENIKVYVIHRADGGDIYIQLSGNSASGKLNILQKEAFKQTITLLKADQIQSQLAEKGKAVLYINFDVDKATLKPEGQEAVQEIEKVLQSDKGLKLSIEGHTDDTGNADHNKKLSEDRAKTVLKALVTSGTDQSRLKAVGYGAQKPSVPNDSEENRAKNRRVELVKIN